MWKEKERTIDFIFCLMFRNCIFPPITRKGYEVEVDSWWSWIGSSSQASSLSSMTVDLDAAIRLLRLLTPLSASMAFVTVAIGLVTGHWLYSEEKMSNPKFNRTGDPELEYLSKFTVSGLWTLCYTNRTTFRLNHFKTPSNWIFKWRGLFIFSRRDGTLLFQHRLFPNGRVQSRSQWLNTLNPL